MSMDSNRALVRRFFDEVCNGRKLGVADELFAAAHTYTDPAIPGVPPGPAGMKLVIGSYQSAFPDARWEVHETIAEGDAVVTRWTGHGTQRGELNGIAPTGKLVHAPGIWLHRIGNGKIVESHNIWDMLGLLRQLGVIPAH